jgi:hypothetical protein
MLPANPSIIPWNIRRNTQASRNRHYGTDTKPVMTGLSGSSQCSLYSFMVAAGQHSKQNNAPPERNQIAT